MTSEDKRTRSKRCLSRSKRSKTEKSTENEPCPEAAEEIYTAVRSKQRDCLHPNGRSDHLENEVAELTEENSDNCSKVTVLAGKSGNHKNDAFEFCDDEIESNSVPGIRTYRNKRKRIGSEELEVPCFTSTVSRFKRARNAVTYLKQPLVQLEKCMETKGSDSSRTDESPKRNKETASTEILSSTKTYSHWLGEGGTNTLLLVNGQKSELNTENKVKVNSVCKDGKVGTSHNELQAEHELKLQDDKEDCPRNTVCPVCSLTFLPTENMDVINQHINSCLDNRSDKQITENGLSKPSSESIGEELFLCQLCQKDLSKMNSQRRQQHLNRCCDQASKAKEITNLDGVQTSNQLQCPICGKEFKSSKSRQAHLKKCAQECNVETNQLLEIIHRQQADSTGAAPVGIDAGSVAGPTIAHLGRVKRKRGGVTSYLDEQTQIALALSASMAPPPDPDASDSKGVKRKGKKNKCGNELPPLLLRDDETAQRAVAMRAAQVLCTQDDNGDDDDEISCTPALAPSRLAQNIAACQPPVPIGDAESKVHSATTSDCEEDEDYNLINENSGTRIESDEGERVAKEPVESTFTVDPALSKSFLNFLYDVEDEERQAVEAQAPRPSPLWSLAALQEQSSFYVPGLLPPASPPRPKKLPQRAAVAETAVKSENVSSKLNEPAAEVGATKEDTSLAGSKTRLESVTDLQLSTTEYDDCAEITPSQVVNAEMLLELAGEDDISNMSMDSQQMMAASGFCVDEHGEDHKESDAGVGGVPKLLHDLSSMINNPQLSDVVIYLKDGQQMAAHSFILSLRSEVLAQLLSEQRALKKTTSCEWQDKVCLKFNDVRRPPFEVVLRHIYTGDTTISEECDLDDITNLAKRFLLPCLVKACKAAQGQMNQVFKSIEDDRIDDSIATDLEKLEESLWRNDNDDELCDDFQTDKDNKDNFLNDDDIEEIMIFQTQALKRKDGTECEDVKEKRSKLLLELAERKKILSDISHDELTSPTLENMGQKWETMSGKDLLSLNPIEKGHLSHKTREEGNLSCNPVSTANLSHNPVATANLSHNPVVTDSLSHSLVENGGSIPPCDYNEEKYTDELTVSKEKRSVNNEEIMVENERLSPREENITKKQLLPLLSSLKKTDKKKHVAPANFEDKLGLLSHDSNKTEVMISHDSSTDWGCFQDVEPISDLDDVDAQPQDLTEGNNERIVLRQQLEVVQEQRVNINDELSVEDFGLENKEYFTYPSKGLISGYNEVEADDVIELDAADEIHETLSDFQPHRNGDLDLREERNHKEAGLSPPAGEGRWDTNSDLQGSPREVTMLDSDEMDEMAANESITLISDNEEEVFDVSPPKTDITIVPETPCVKRNVPERTSSKSSSALSVSEDNEVSVTGFSPAKTQKQLKEEANDFLSKLKERAGHGKGKRQGKEKTKKGGGPRKSTIETAVKRTTPKKRAPRARKENFVEMSPLENDVKTSPRSYQQRTALPMAESPRGFQACSDLPMQWTPGDVEPCYVSPIWTSPRGLEHQQRSCISDHVTIEHSPPLSPVLFQPQHNSPQNTESKGKEINNSLGVKKLDFEEPGEVEFVETCANKTAMYGTIGLSTSSSPRDVMSPPVPSPEYSFLEPVSSPGSPVPCTSPLQKKTALSPGSVSPSLSIDWKSPVSERGLGTFSQSHSPVSPSVCSFSSQTAAASTQGRREEPARKLDLEQSLNNSKKTKAVEIKEIDPSLPLMERIRAARNGGRETFEVKDVEEDGSDSNSDTGSTKDEVESTEKLSSQQVDNIFMDADFYFYDDGGYNIEVEEFNNREGFLDDDNLANVNEQGDCLSKDAKVVQQRKASKVVTSKRKIPPSQQRLQDSDDEDKPQEAPKKRCGKKTDSHSSKPVGQTVSQPITPMPNYIDMATPVLKNELYKFGVRPLPKKKMVLKLTEIYDYTHQVEPPSQKSKTESAPNTGKPLSSNAVVSDAVDGVEGSGTASSDNSDEDDTEFGDCTVMIEDEAITASQQVNGGNLKEKLISYIQNNKELYRKVVKFQPLELVSLQQQIKSDGISCPLGKLVDFLDEQCITFTTAGSRPRAQKKRGRKKKINNKPA